MSPNFWQAIASTSWWIIPGSAFVFLILYQSLKPKTIPVQGLTVMPILIFLMALIGIFIYVQFTSDNLFLFAYLFMFGAGIGWLNYRFLNIKAIKGQLTLHIPGSFTILLFGSVIGVCEYYFGIVHLSVTLATLLDILHNSIQLMAIFGFFSGFFAGRILYIRHVLKFGPFMAPAH